LSDTGITSTDAAASGRSSASTSSTPDRHSIVSTRPRRSVLTMPEARGVTSGAALGVSVSVTNRQAGTSHLRDYLLHEITICPRGANQDAVVDAVYEEHLSKCVRLEHNFEYPRYSKTVYVEDGVALKQPRHLLFT